MISLPVPPSKRICGHSGLEYYLQVTFSSQSLQGLFQVHNVILVTIMTLSGAAHIQGLITAGIERLATAPYSNNSDGAILAQGINLGSAKCVTVPLLYFLPAESCFLLLSFTGLGSKVSP